MKLRALLIGINNYQTLGHFFYKQTCTRECDSPTLALYYHKSSEKQLLEGRLWL